MRQIKCREIGVDCDFVAQGNTDEEVVEACRKHGKEAHGMQTLPPELEQKVRRHISDVSGEAPMHA